MKILLAPSERKTLGGNFPPISKNSFIFPEIYEKRKEAVKKYDEFLKTTDDIKNFGDDKTSVFERPVKKAVLRYSGVAFEHMKYEELDKSAQKWIDENVYIFSNLFGVISAGDLIPHYTLKQGSKPGFDIYSYYKEVFSPVLEKINESEPFIDLRAKFYEKIYKPKNAITFKFIKNGKVVSHFAKAYRGKLSAVISKHRPETIEDVLKIPFEDIKIIEIQKKKGVKEIVCEVF
ncbi:peroxide stress protein YaaA [Nautilia sp. PV-1]|uniref:YaaA family protein n=1 Tax=Nautilia sp. PV-1 TaxID=2579250 RepID=UPI000FD915A1|nr:YaaA family protein [Nautilia sp. PV-1]AZV45758.1 peroxide stress protein YaaA [Nautilia sp. PV-1]